MTNKSRGWRSHWATLVPLGLIYLLLSAVSVAYWQNAIAESEHRMANQADYEDEALCVKFGFVRGSAQNNSCKSDLLTLRYTHDNELMDRLLP